MTGRAEGERAGLSRRRFLQAGAAGAALWAGGPLGAALRVEAVPEGIGSAARPPNLIVLFLDDLGYGDVGAYGCPDIPTPHIDRLASQGVRCTNAYTKCPVCSPSRAALMTGMYPQRFGVHGNEDRGAPIPDDHPTLAEFLRDAGYMTGMVGRWDLGSVGQGPLDRGFREVARRSTLPRDDPRRDPGLVERYGGVTYLQEDGVYWTDRNRGELVDFVTRHKDRPFFLYWSPLAVHFPVEEAPREYLDRVPAAVTDPMRRFLAATLIAADDAVGELMAALDRLGLAENTAVIFTSDNGGAPRDGARNLPFRDGKASHGNGGVRIPFLFRWPRRVAAGQTFDGLLSTLDVYATAAALAGAAAPPRLDGRNLVPYMAGETRGDVHEELFWNWLEGPSPRRMQAIRRGPWRLVRVRQEDPWKLYDLAADPGETRNLAEEHPGRVRELAGRFDAWHATLPGPSGMSRGPGGRTPRGIGWATPENP